MTGSDLGAIRTSWEPHVPQWQKVGSPTYPSGSESGVSRLLADCGVHIACRGDQHIHLLSKINQDNEIQINKTKRDQTRFNEITCE